MLKQPSVIIYSDLATLRSLAKLRLEAFCRAGQLLSLAYRRSRSRTIRRDTDSSHTAPACHPVPGVRQDYAKRALAAQLQPAERTNTPRLPPQARFYDAFLK